MSNPIKCLVIDGFHKGHSVTVTSPLQQLVLLKPVTITIDNCCGSEVVGIDQSPKKEYMLAGYSIDRSIAFYSTDGSMESLFKRDWVAPSDGLAWHEQPIYIGIHDPRAVINNSTIEEN